MMWEGGVTPNLVTFNSLVNGLCKPGRMQDARKVFDEIVREGLVYVFYTRQPTERYPKGVD